MSVHPTQAPADRIGAGLIVDLFAGAGKVERAQSLELTGPRQRVRLSDSLGYSFNL